MPALRALNPDDGERASLPQRSVKIVKFLNKSARFRLAGAFVSDFRPYTPKNVQRFVFWQRSRLGCGFGPVPRTGGEPPSGAAAENPFAIFYLPSSIFAPSHFDAIVTVSFKLA